MRTQRVYLGDQLRADTHGDDITPRLMARQQQQKGRNGSDNSDGDDALKSVFEAELKKYDPQVKVIGQNLRAQENILKALTETNAKYATTRRVVAELIGARKNQVGRDLKVIKILGDSVTYSTSQSQPFLDYPTIMYFQHGLISYFVVLYNVIKCVCKRIAFSCR